MSETLIGVIVGGLLASIVPVVSLIQQNRQWKKEKRLAYLQQERIKLSDVYVRSFKKFIEEMSTKKVSLDLLSEILFILPEDIRREFLITDSAQKNVSNERKAELLTLLINVMNKSLEDIDQKIEALLN